MLFLLDSSREYDERDKWSHDRGIFLIFSRILARRPSLSLLRLFYGYVRDGDIFLFRMKLEGNIFIVYLVSRCRKIILSARKFLQIIYYFEKLKKTLSLFAFLRYIKNLPRRNVITIT